MVFESVASATAETSITETTEPATTTGAAIKRKPLSASGTKETKKQKRSEVYECPICKWVFKKKFNLDTHVKTHDRIRMGNFSCPDCTKSFARKLHLTRHIKTVHQKIKEHVCGFCGTQYTRADNLKKHVEKKHPNN
ncbi:uncharacterized protein EV154DRAFT_421545 [Mucor mucedo]|uniref:uncharacterized protein n=1 Tax=Mucor mucedo TaxID=29922 RepID=UPI0022207114|nr:uncharacterized protein EV154DRAFT_421545 [Mucor mucedo]KAI7890749.1 hypothetical protein EV154DRAFT_421545 [Mucor mucedo]